MTGWNGQTERYYLLRVREIRWWTLAELDEAREVTFAPRRLPAFLRGLLRDGPPAEPLDVGV
jgi:hypothetical protein